MQLSGQKSRVISIAGLAGWETGRRGEGSVKDEERAWTCANMPMFTSNFGLSGLNSPLLFFFIKVKK